MNMANMSKVRDLMKVGGVILAAFGLGDEATFNTLIDTIMVGLGAATTLVGLVWTHFASRSKAVVAEAAKTVPIAVAVQKAADVPLTQITPPSQATVQPL